MTKFTSNTDFELKSVKIFPLDGREPVEMKPMVQAINYVESVLMPFVSATASVIDSAGFLQDLPIQGTEKVVFSVLTNQSEEQYEYTMRVWTITNRFAQQNKQAYTLGLVSEEALLNEYTRINQPLKGNPESIISRLLQKDLRTAKDIFSEPSLFEVNYLPTRERPFNIIDKLASKAMSPQAKFNNSKTKKDPNKTEDANKSSAKSLKGSGGFFFWESKRGYNFFAVDSLCADEDSELKSKKLDAKSWGPYVERVANQSDGADDRFGIFSSTFTSDADIMNSLRDGKFGTRLVLFNHSTGQYEEYDYSMSDSYDNMAHLGGQDALAKVPASQIDLSKFPSRLMSVFLDHETWYNDPAPASPEPQDGGKDPTKFADWQKYYAAQSVARFKLLRNQQCTIVIPGNPEICAGDKIDIRLINKKPTSELNKESVDNESSGLYLVKELTQTYDTLEGTNGRYTTTLRLMRDSFGMKGKQSSHSNK